MLEGIHFIEKIDKNCIQFRGVEGVYSEESPSYDFADEEEMLAVDEDLKARFLAAKEEKQILE